MDLDRLKKLVKLANNNPNEHEANSAARKVCLILEQENFVLTNTLKDNPSSRVPKDIFEEMFRKAYNHRAWDDGAPPRTEPPPNWENPFYKKKYEPTYNPYEPKQPKPKRDLKCTKCGNVKSTPFVGNEAVFICQSCQWTDFENSKRNKYST